MHLFTKQKHKDIESKLMVTKGEKGKGRDKLRAWDQQTHTSIYKIDIQQGSLYSTENYIQYPVTTIMEKNIKKKKFHLFIYIFIKFYLYINK